MFEPFVPNKTVLLEGSLLNSFWEIEVWDLRFLFRRGSLKFSADQISKIGHQMVSSTDLTRKSRKGNPLPGFSFICLLCWVGIVGHVFAPRIMRVLPGSYEIQPSHFPPVLNKAKVSSVVILRSSEHTGLVQEQRPWVLRLDCDSRFLGNLVRLVVQGEPVDAGNQCCLLFSKLTPVSMWNHLNFSPLAWW